jgi:hypothetical protein
MACRTEGLPVVESTLVLLFSAVPYTVPMRSAVCCFCLLTEYMIMRIHVYPRQCVGISFSCGIEPSSVCSFSRAF